MSWQDGSRFLVASGVKWGSGPKYYKGSQRDTPWNKDLLWKLYVEQEARKMKLPLRVDEHDLRPDAMPPYMKSLAHANNPEEQQLKLWDPYRHDQFKTGGVLTDREADWKTLVGPHGLPLMHRGSPRSWSARKKDMDAEKTMYEEMKIATQTGGNPEEALRKLAGGGGGAGAGAGAAKSAPKSASSAGGRSARRRPESDALEEPSLRSARTGSVPATARSSSRSLSAATLKRLERLEMMVKAEERKRANLERNLEGERAEREKLAETESKMEKKMQAYDEIMKNLMEAMNKSSARKSARASGRA